MKHFLTILTLAIMASAGVSAAAQSYYDDVYVIEETAPIPANETKQQRKERVKADKEIVDSVYNLKSVRALRDGYFVLQATQVSGSYGMAEYGLNDNTNFLLLQGNKGIVQTATSYHNPGANGLGGITLHGRVGKMKISTDKKGNVTADFNMNGRSMNAHVFITVYGGGDQAMAQITPTMGAGQITLRGRLVPYRDDSISINP